ncbi:TetR/AcrR family transcriptional regulator [Catenulispora subtropica]|uniref:TetR/AcrR family transcriptional regulator n=1 Tax=Catenulispora subtropica TaxID=450798 RepID=A0ABP5D896_9ACTN
MTTRGPRSFDRDAALDIAMTLFWRHGYEATSVAALTKAMGINPPSMYAAFGDKRRLFSEAVRRYAETHGSYGAKALEQTTSYDVVETMLHLAAAEYAGPGHPPGCLVVDGATNTAEASDDVKQELRAFREGIKQAIAARIAADVEAGLLPPDIDAPALAMFYAAVVQGMSTQARDGATPDELRRMADVALTAWPGGPGEARDVRENVRSAAVSSRA